MSIYGLSDEELDELELLIDEHTEQRVYNAWTTGDLTYKLHAGQRKIWDTIQTLTTSEALLFISRQWGKSYLSCVYAISFCIRNPGSIVRIAAPKLKQAMDIVQDNLNPICADAPEGMVKSQKSSYRWTIGQSELRLGILERAHVDTLRGGNAKLVILEEGGFVSSDDYAYALRSVIAPQLLHSKGLLLHVTTPSEEPDHYIHTEVLPVCKSEGSLFEFDIYSNPRIDQEQIDRAAKLCGGYHSEAFKREYLVKIIRESSRVCVPEFHDHLVYEYDKPEYANWFTCGDWGGIRDKTAMLLCFWDFMHNKLVFWDELFFTANTPTDAIMQDFFANGFGQKRVIMDAPGQLLVDIRDKFGVNAVLPNKDDWMAAINAFRVAIGSGAIAIHPRCQWLIQTLQGATFNKQRTDLDRTEALGHMDMLMAAVYANRMADRVTNPWPAFVPDVKNKLYTKETLLSKSKQQKVGSAFLLKGRK